MSLGGAIYPNDAQRIDRLIYCADMALLQAKSSGRNKSFMFDEKLLKREVTCMTREPTTNLCLALCPHIGCWRRQHLPSTRSASTMCFRSFSGRRQNSIRPLTVNSDGKITLSVIGEITAAGLSPSALGRKIVEQVSRFNRDISQATVTVTAYNSQTVFVEGEVSCSRAICERSHSRSLVDHQGNGGRDGLR